MNEISLVMVRVEYEKDGSKASYLGVIDKEKLENYKMGEGNYLFLENDGDIAWIDKESLISIERLKVSSILYVKPRITDYCQVNKEENTKISI